MYIQSQIKFIKMPKTKEWTCVSGTVILSDPCYPKSYTEGRMKLSGKVNNIKKGKWKVEVLEDEETSRNTEIITYHESYKGHIDSEKWKEFSFSVCVDSGQAGIFDTDIYPDSESTGEYEDRKTFYGKCCELTLNGSNWGIVDKGGIVSSSGWGDGSYPSYYVKKGNEIIAMRIVFIGEDVSDTDDE